MKRSKRILLVLCFIWPLMFQARQSYAQTEDTGDTGNKVYLPFVLSAVAPAQDESLRTEGYKENTSEATINASAVAANPQILLPTAYATTKGKDGGQPTSNLRVQDQSGSWFYGSLPGTFTFIYQHPNGTNVAVLFNQRTDPSGLPYDTIKSAMDTVIASLP